jgi:putative transposase
MPNYRRFHVPGGSYFLTIVTHRRRPLFSDAEAVQHLRIAARAVRLQWPFEILAAVILPDHLHFIGALPHGDDAYARRVGRLKALFSSQYGCQASDCDVQFEVAKKTSGKRHLAKAILGAHDPRR